MARERPTASEDQPGFRAREVGARTNVDVLTRAQAHALSHGPPPTGAGRGERIAVRSGHWRAPAERGRIGELRRQVACFAALAGMPEGDLADFQVAVSEALTNAVLHAYRDRDFAGDVSVDADVAGDELLVWVRDHGTGMAPRTDSPGMGVGLSIIGRLCKRHSVRCCDDGGTEVGMCFDLPHERGGRPHADGG